MKYHLMDNKSYEIMKKILFLLFICIGFIGFGQSKIELAKSYLKEDPCNSEGILRVKNILGRDPNNTEAKELLLACDKEKYNKAIEGLKENNNDANSRVVLERLVKSNEFNTEEANFLLALANKNGNLYEYITKAIEFNPSNLEYRWLRLESYANKNSTVETLKLVIDDADFMMLNGANTGKVNFQKAKAERCLAFSLYKKPVENNSSFSDDNSKDINQLKLNYKEAVNLYRSSIKFFKKATELDSKIDTSSIIITCEEKIKEIEKKLANI